MFPNLWIFCWSDRWKMKFQFSFNLYMPFCQEWPAISLWIDERLFQTFLWKKTRGSRLQDEHTLFCFCSHLYWCFRLIINLCYSVSQGSDVWQGVLQKIEKSDYGKVTMCSSACPVSSAKQSIGDLSYIS